MDCAWMYIQNRALNAEVGQALAPWLTFVAILVSRRPCPGAREVQVWIKGHPNWTKVRARWTALGQKVHLAKTSVFTMFWICWGGPWRPSVGSRGPSEALQEANDSLVAAQRARGSFGIYGNGRKRAGTDANGWERTQTNPKSSRIRGQSLSKGQDI